MSVLQRTDDLHDLLAAYLARASADSITGAEIFFDPQGHTARGISLSTFIDGITSALRLGERTLGSPPD